MKPTLVIALILLLIAVLVAPAAPQARAIAAAASRDQQIAQAAESLRARLVEQRRDFHVHPELSNREERTARIVAQALRALGLDEVKTNVGKHGIVALLKGAKPGPVVAVRTDMDALPIQETIDVPFKSQTPSSTVICTSWPQACLTPGVCDLYGTSIVS